MKKKHLSSLLAILLCLTQFAQISNTLSENNIYALFNANGSNFWDQQSGNPWFIVPKNNPNNNSSHFVNSIWIGGYDVTNNLHMTAQTYMQKGSDYFSGPISNSTGYANSAAWYKVWKVDKSTINSHKLNFQTSNYVVPLSIAKWPGNGNTAYGQASQMAPYVDINQNGIYEPALGDYPCIKGNSAIYYIMNDEQSTHTESGGSPMGIEIHCMAYEFLTTSNEINNTLFMDYKIYNRSNNNYQNVYLSSFDDFDLGNYNDDYIGTNISKNTYYVYNGDSNDENNYGTTIPSLGVTFLKTPLAPTNDGKDNNHNGFVDEINEELGLSGTQYYNTLGGAPYAANPTTALQYYNYTKSSWLDGTHLKCGGTGYGGTTNTNYCYSGNTYSLGGCSSNWVETGIPGDRRVLGSCGPFNFASNSMIELTVAYVWGIGTTTGAIAGVNKMFATTDTIHKYYNQGVFNNMECVNISTSIFKNKFSDNILKVYPNPNNGLFTIDIIGTENYVVQLYDIAGHLVLTQEIENGNSIINANHLDAGIYNLSIKTNSGNINKKVILVK